MLDISKEFKDSLLGKIPREWEIYKISDICFVGRGRVISQLELDEHPGIYPVYSSQSKDEGIFGYLDTFDFNGEYVTWTTDGAYAGSVFYRTGEFNCTNVCGTLQAKSDKLIMKYLAFALSTRTSKHVSYVGNPKLMNNVMGEIIVPLPPLPEQHRIAEILHTIDEAIARTDSLIQKLKLMKAGLLNDLLTCGLDENGELRDPIKHPEQFKDSVLGRIPREWEVKNLGEACSLIKDGSHLPPKRVEKGVLLLSVQNMINGRLQLTDLDTRVSWDFYKTMHKNWTIQVGDILLAIVGATIGKTAVVPFSFPKFTLQRSVAILRGQQGLLENSFLRLYLSSDKFQKIIWHRVNQTAQPGIYLAELAGFKIPAPTTEEQKKIFNIIDTHDTRIRTEETYLNKLKRQKQGLMHDLLTGKMRVT